jgi:hypothetical protein
VIDEHALTPVAAERRLLVLDNEMTLAELALRRARDTEVDKQHEFEAAERAAFLDASCPRPSRGGFTVADREVFVADRCAVEQRAFDIAKSACQGAYDHLETVGKQSMICMALLRSVTTAYNMSGVSQHEGV